MPKRLAPCLLAALCALCAARPQPAKASKKNASPPPSAANPSSHAAPLPEIVTDKNTDGQRRAGGDGREPRAGELRVVRGGGASAEGVGLCPLRHTDVRASVAGFAARVTVTQVFENTFDEAVEAVYVFPLPHGAAVDDMRMRVGGRTVRARIMRREEAQAAYRVAREAGQRAALLEQERPNIFTQSVTNVTPGARLTVTLSYVELLRYERGSYEFVFPLTVGPRYVPAHVPEAARVTPHAAARAGHGVSLEVLIDAGLPVTRVTSVLHDVQVRAEERGRLRVRLRDAAEVPDRDFVLRYRTAGGRIDSALLAHRDEQDGRGGFFTLILQPPERAEAEDATPKELVFVLDTSGSMEGFPLEKAKETMRLALDGLNPQDTFNLVTFSGDTRVLFAAPVAATPENLRAAQAFLEAQAGGGGTEMMAAVRAALAPSDSRRHVRVVCFMTDGQVGNDFEIVSEIQRHPNARVFAFGIGDSPNRFLLDKMAEAGRGEVEYVSLSDDGSLAARRFHERVRSPLLIDISVDWGGLAVSEILPRRVPDLFDAKPVVLTGRYARPGAGVVRLRGRLAGRPYEREFAFELPASRPDHDALASVWARRKIDELTARDFDGIQSGDTDESVREEITRLGLDFRLMTQFTSFVAVEERVVNEGGRQLRIDVPVESPAGVSLTDAPGGHAHAANNSGAAGGGAAHSAVAEAFTMSEMFKNVGPVPLAVSATLALMALSSCAVACFHLFVLSLTRRHSRRFARALTHALARTDPRAALARLERRHAAAPLAAPSSAALLAFDRAGGRLSRPEIASVEIQLRRAILNTGARMRVGLGGLSTVGSTAPLVGLLGTLVGVAGALHGAATAEAAGIAAIAGGLAEALLTAALGLAVGIPAVWASNYFKGRAARLVAEMENSSSELIGFLLRHPGGHPPRHGDA